MPNASPSTLTRTTGRDPVAATTDARQRLRSSSYHALVGVRCELIDGAMVLRGRLPSFHLKQLAQEVVREADTARAIVNEVQVDDRGRSPVSGNASESTPVGSEENRGASWNPGY